MDSDIYRSSVSTLIARGFLHRAALGWTIMAMLLHLGNLGFRKSSMFELNVHPTAKVIWRRGSGSTDW